MSLTAAYLQASGERESCYLVPEVSSRARSIPVYAALRTLGRKGVASLVERCCDHAVLMGDLLRESGLQILNDVVLNQVLVAATPEHVARVQEDGTCRAGGTVWRGTNALGVSFSNWSTTEADVWWPASAIIATA